MKDILKRTSILAGLLGMVVAILAFIPCLAPLFHGESFKPHEQAWAILAFLILWITSVSIAIFQQLEIMANANELHEKAENAGKEGYQKFMDILQVDNDFYDDTWLYEKLKVLAKFRKDTEGNHIHLRPELEEAITLAFEQHIHNVHTLLRLDFSRDDEFERMRRLKKAVEDAKCYVYAVTYDANGYMGNFWSGEFSTEYMKSNDRAGTNVIVKRVFVVEREVISGKNRAKHVKLKRIIQQHKRSRLPNIEVRVVCIEALPPSWKGINTSLLVCDDVMASESYTFSNTDEEVQGYVEYNNMALVEKLKKRFDDLLAAPDETQQLLRRLNLDRIQQQA